MSVKSPEKIKMKKLEEYWLVLVKHYLKLPALVKYYIETIQINLSNQHWNDKKPVFKIPFGFHLISSGQELLSGIKCFFFCKSKIEKERICKLEYKEYIHQLDFACL